MLALFRAASAAVLFLLGAANAARAEEPAAQAVLATYADMAQAMFEDGHAAARDMKAAIDAFLATPNADTLASARQAWKDARPWYQHSEPYRFGNEIVDAWEGRINAWPLDEGLIDYVEGEGYGAGSEDNPLYRANVIANPTIRIGKDMIDASVITPELLRDRLNQAAGAEANVAIGYHAIEFLLWGQDLNGTGPGAGNRPASDYDLAACTHGHCDRRRAYLAVVTDLLVADMAEMAAAWRPGGPARAELAAKGEAGGLATIAKGIGSLAYGELAGQRMKLGVTLHDPEEEHDCFSDNTQNSHYGDVIGMIAVYSGVYERRDGTTFAGPALAAYAKARAPAEAAAFEAALNLSLARVEAIKAKADSGTMAYDQMLASGNEVGNALILDAVSALVAQTRALETLGRRLGLNVAVEGSDALGDAGSN